MIKNDLKHQIDDLLMHLSEREAEILRQRFGLTADGTDLTLEQIGQMFDVDG